MMRSWPPGGATLICGAPLTNPPPLLVSPPTYSRRPYRSHTCSALFHFCPLSRCCATRPVELVPTSSPSIRLTRGSYGEKLGQSGKAGTRSSSASGALLTAQSTGSAGLAYERHTWSDSDRRPTGEASVCD